MGFLRKMAEKKYVGYYMAAISRTGWVGFKSLLERKYERYYFMGVLLKQSQNLIEELKASRNFGEDNLIRVF